MWDDEAFDEPEDGELDDEDDLDAEVEALAWACALSDVAWQLWRAVGHVARCPVPHPTPVCGWWPGRLRLDESEAMRITLAVGQARLQQSHNEFIISELMHVSARGGNHDLT
jgi:hypothetical protein